MKPNVCDDGQWDLSKTLPISKLTSNLKPITFQKSGRKILWKCKCMKIGMLLQKNLFPLWFKIVRLQRRDKVGSWIKNIFRSHWEANRKSFKGQLHQFIYAPSLRENLLDFQVELRLKRRYRTWTSETDEQTDERMGAHSIWFCFELFFTDLDYLYANLVCKY